MPVLSATKKMQKVSYKGRERGGLDTMAFNETFPGSTINTSQWGTAGSGMTVAQTGGAMVLNSGLSGTSGNWILMNSFAGIGSPGGFPTYIEFKFSLAQALQPNNTIEIGAGYVANTAAPTDGVFLRFSGTSIVLVVNNNGTEITKTVAQAVSSSTGAAVPGSLSEQSIVISSGVRYHLEIIVSEDLVEFWLNGQFLGHIAPNGTPLGAATGSLGLITLSNSWPMTARLFNSATVGTPQSLSIYEVCALNGDADDYKPWGDVVACAGWSTIQGRTASGTVGQQANYANSAAPSSATLSNTAAGYTTLGGQWQFAAVAGAETDYALFAWQNPAGTAAVPGSQVHIKRIRISAFNTVVAVATTPTVMQWAVATGSTAVSLATTDGAGNIKGPRRMALGCMTWAVGAAVGAMPANGDIDVTFDVPLVVNPGEFIHLILKMPIATATATEVFRGTAAFIGYAD